jgi:hypothetical protein
MHLGRQSAARAPHASGCIDVPSGGCRRALFLTLPRAGEHGPRSCRPSAGRGRRRVRRRQTADPRRPLPPANIAVVAGGVGTIPLRDVGPGRPCPQPPEDAVEHLAVVHPCDPARLVWQQRLNDRPLEIADLIPAWLHGAPLATLNHLGPRLG